MFSKLKKERICGTYAEMVEQLTIEEIVIDIDTLLVTWSIKITKTPGQPTAPPGKETVHMEPNGYKSVSGMDKSAMKHRLGGDLTL